LILPRSAFDCFSVHYFSEIFGLVPYSWVEKPWPACFDFAQVPRFFATSLAASAARGRPPAVAAAWNYCLASLFAVVPWLLWPVMQTVVLHCNLTGQASPAGSEY